MLDCDSSASPICDTTQEALDTFIVDSTAGWKPSVVGTLAGRHCLSESVSMNIDQAEKHLTL